MISTKYFIAAVLGISLLFGALLWIMHSSSTNFHRQLLKNEYALRDSIMQKIVHLQNERGVLQVEINALHDDIKAQTEELKSTIKRIKIIVNVPKIDYSGFSDTALVARLLAD